jgi:hypothetical protein
MLLAMLFESSNGIVRVERERFVEGSRDAREHALRLRFQSNIYRVVELCYVWDCVTKRQMSFALGFPSTNSRPPKQQNSGVSIPILNLGHQYLH